eukprot:4274486-Amphidinium_carterae.3
MLLPQRAFLHRGSDTQCAACTSCPQDPSHQKGAQQGLNVKAMAEYVGVKLEADVTGTAAESIELFSTSSVARAFALRVGLAKQFLRVQEKPRNREIAVNRGRTKDNTADVLPRPLAGSMVRKHLKCLGFEFRRAWNPLHRSLRAAEVFENIVTSNAEEGIYAADDDDDDDS